MGLMVELVTHNDADEICRYLTHDDEGQEPLEVLQEANDLFKPIPFKKYIRECKGMGSFGDGS
jgi:hypothetical protein